MPRKFRNIVDTIKATPKEIINYLDTTATKHGKASWFIKHPKSQNNVCLVAHIDTIFAPPTEVTVSENLIMTSAQDQGLGADDRAGVWALLKIYNSVADEDKPMLLFTDGEERGGHGAHEACEILNEELKDVIFFVELDRQACVDAVFYNNEPKKFVNYIEQYGFKESRGSFSDISILGRHFQKCAVNLSVGYVNQHTKSEFLNLKHLYATVSKVREILRTNSAVRVPWENKYEAPKYNWSTRPYEETAIMPKSDYRRHSSQDLKRTLDERHPKQKPSKLAKKAKTSWAVPQNMSAQEVLDFVHSMQNEEVFQQTLAKDVEPKDATPTEAQKLEADRKLDAVVTPDTEF